MKRIWWCKIGEVDEALLRPGADFPMRAAIRAAYRDITGQESDYIFSGWNAKLTAGEQEAVYMQGDVWNPEWTEQFHYYPDGRRKFINPRVHLLHRFGDTPGVDARVYAYWLKHNVRFMQFRFTSGMRLPDGSIGMVAATRTFDLVKVAVGHEEYGAQWAAPLDAAVWHRVRSDEDAQAVLAELAVLAYGAA